MKLTQILIREHQLIEQALNWLDDAARRAEADGSLPAQQATDAVTFLRGFGGQWHHRKEEICLLSAMADLGMSLDDGRIAAIQREHEQEDDLLRGIETMMDGAADGDQDALYQLARYAYAYVGLRREHIHRENDRLFTLADRLLNEDVQQQLLDALEKVEAEQRADPQWETCERIAEALADQSSAAVAAESDAAYQAACVGE
jgi:hemerythrin-like domain-containing protein